MTTARPIPSARRRGHALAGMAFACALILLAAYHMLAQGTPYRDLGPAHFDERRREAVERRLVHRLQTLGYKVTLEPAA